MIRGSTRVSGVPRPVSYLCTSRRLPKTGRRSLALRQCAITPATRVPSASPPTAGGVFSASLAGAWPRMSLRCGYRSEPGCAAGAFHRPTSAITCQAHRAGRADVRRPEARHPQTLARASAGWQRPSSSLPRRYLTPIATTALVSASMVRSARCTQASASASRPCRASTDPNVMRASPANGSPVQLCRSASSIACPLGPAASGIYRVSSASPR